MTKAMQQAIRAMESLPAEARDICANRIVKNVDKLLQLRTDVQKGVISIERGDTYTMKEMRSKFNKKYGV